MARFNQCDAQFQCEAREIKAGYEYKGCDKLDLLATGELLHKEPTQNGTNSADEVQTNDARVDEEDQKPVVLHEPSLSLSAPVCQNTLSSINPNQDRYVGENVSGMPQGWGRMDYVDGSFFEGEWKVGKPYGQGSLTVPGIGTYNGVWNNGQRHGAFNLQCENGDLIEWEYKHEKIVGEVKITKSNGDICVLEYSQENKRQKGKIQYVDGSTFEGECWFSHAPPLESQSFNGLPDGSGIRTKDEGSRKNDLS